ncbi:MAG: hypothetical protein ALAOOOJD_01998 [bacterium]|nr:hypothetical protein [bacterium]
MKIPTLLLLILAPLLSLSCQKTSDQTASNLGQKQFDPSKSDPQAIQIADEVMVALGGYENFAAVNYLSFHFVVVVDSQKTSDWRHDWDRRKNNYRVEGITRDGDHLLAIFNLDSRDGVAFKNGQTLDGEEKIQLLKRAYARYINDTFWLLMPFKLKDPGAVLQYDGAQEINEVNYDVLRLSYADSVGLTPHNIYRLFVDQNTRIIHRWEYFEKAGAAPAAAWWEKWQKYGNIKLAGLRGFENSNRQILFTDIIAAAEVDEKIFEVASTSQAGMF